MFALPGRGDAKRVLQKPASASAPPIKKTAQEYNPVWQSLAMRSFMIQPKLTVSQPGDPYEQEADHIANQVMRMPEPRLQRACACGGTCTTCKTGQPDDEHLQTKRVQANSAGVTAAPPIVQDVLRSPGQPLDQVDRTFFESRFGHDFSQVRVHTDARAAESAKSVSALAYTVGRDIVFGAGQYAPGASGGRRLIAHELSHVTQQAAGLLQRTPDPADLAEFDTRVTALRTHAVFVGLPADAKKEVDEIITEARTRDNPLYYIGKLELLVNTPEEDEAKQAVETSTKIEDAATAEATRLTDQTNKDRKEDEETISKARAPDFKKATGQGGKTFEIDARDVTNIAVRAKVQLVKAGKGKDIDVLRVKSLEDAIEKRIAMMGYSVDLDFVNNSGDDVFTVDVDTSQWTTSGNWADSDEALAHELHHLLGLGDRYDYIEAHADNKKMKIPSRIHWFREELRKPISNNPASMMHTGTNLPLDDDICMVAGNKSKADIDACVQKRTEARTKIIGPALGKAAIRARRAHGVLSGILPASPFDKKGEPSSNQLKQQQAMSLALKIFGKPISLETATDAVGATRYELMLYNLYLASALTKGCDASPVVSRNVVPRLLLCPSFFSLTEEQQSKAILREALHRAGVGDVTTDTVCPMVDCENACGDDTNAFAWIRFIMCIVRDIPG